MRHHTWHLVPILYPFVAQITSEKMRYRPSWLSDILHSLALPIIHFRNENNIEVLLYPVRNHLTVGTRLRQTSVSNIGFGIQIIPRWKVLEAPTMWGDIRMTSEKVINCYHESQQLVERTRFYHLVFIMKMVFAHECSSRGAFGV